VRFDRVEGEKDENITGWRKTRSGKKDEERRSSRRRKEKTNVQRI